MCCRSARFGPVRVFICGLCDVAGTRRRSCRAVAFLELRRVNEANPRGHLATQARSSLVTPSRWSLICVVAGTDHVAVEHLHEFDPEDLRSDRQQDVARGDDVRRIAGHLNHHGVEAKVVSTRISDDALT